MEIPWPAALRYRAILSSPRRWRCRLYRSRRRLGSWPGHCSLWLYGREERVRIGFTELGIELRIPAGAVLFLDHRHGVPYQKCLATTLAWPDLPRITSVESTSSRFRCCHPLGD